MPERMEPDFRPINEIQKEHLDIVIQALEGNLKIFKLFRNELSIKEIPITYIFTNSSLSLKVIMDSVWMLYNMFFFRKKWR